MDDLHHIDLEPAEPSWDNVLEQLNRVCALDVDVDVSDLTADTITTPSSTKAATTKDDITATLRSVRRQLGRLIHRISEK